MFTDDSPVALFDDNLSGSDSLLLHALRQTLICECSEEIEQTFAAIEVASAQGYWVALAAAYELGEALQPRLRKTARISKAPLLTAWVFESAEQLSPAQTDAAIHTALSKLDEHRCMAGAMSLDQPIDRAAYCRNVERIRELIAAGDCYQVNYTYPLSGTLLGDPLALYAALRTSQPVRYGSFIRHPAGAVLSRSPELFVQREGDRLTCRPMKGTAPRAQRPEQLGLSEKDRAENVMIVDLIRNDLGRLAPPGGVRVESLFDIEAYPSLWQMTSTVSARPVRADLSSIFRALFPCGSITGAPKIRAMEVIRELEPVPRGLYCGALGWIAPGGDFRFSVPIRTLEASRQGHFRCGLGSGIVADSEPAAEWSECRLKSRFLTNIRPDLALIETLRCEPGTSQPFPLLERHLRRLRTSARALGFKLDESRLRNALQQLAATLSGTHRVRLALRDSACFDLQHTPLQALETDMQTVVISAARVRADDPLLRHKSTARALYDAELARTTQAGHFDVLFFNEHDELTEGARSNVFVDTGETQLLTPPLSCGVLDGVYRRKLLDQRRAREAIVSRRMLLNARALYVCNALRGLIPVHLNDS